MKRQVEICDICEGFIDFGDETTRDADAPPAMPARPTEITLTGHRDWKGTLCGECQIHFEKATHEFLHNLDSRRGKRALDLSRRGPKPVSESGNYEAKQAW